MSAAWNRRESRTDPVSYEALRHQVLRRDGWRCQSCSMSNLEVHYKQFRSHSGDDSEENPITLCSTAPFIRSLTDGIARVRRAA